MNKIDKPLATLIKKKRERTEINKIKKLKVKKEIQRLIRDYYKQLYANKMDNLKEVNKFLQTHNLPIMNQEKNRKYEKMNHNC